MKTSTSPFRSLAVIAAATLATSPLFAQITNIGAWGINGDGQTDIPVSPGAIKKLSLGATHTLALLTNGTVVAWGANASGQCNVPASATNMVDIAAGGLFSLARRSNGGLVYWGVLDSTPSESSNPSRTVIAAGVNYALANGFQNNPSSVQSWGQPDVIITKFIPNVVALAAGRKHNVALDSNGTVFCWSPSFLPLGLLSVATNMPAGLSNVTAIAAGDYHTLALQSNGTVVAWGMNDAGQTNVPVDLTNAVSIAAGGKQSLAVTANGKVVTWGLPPTDPVDFTPRIAPPDLTNVVAIAASGGHVFALTTQPVPCVTQPPRSRSVPIGWPVTFKITASGQAPLSYQWQLSGTNLPTQTNSFVTMSNVASSNLGDYRAIVTNSFGSATSLVANLVSGSVLAWGLNSSEQCWLHPKFTNATALAGGNSTTHAIGTDGRLSAAGLLFYTNDFAPMQFTTDAVKIASSGLAHLVIRSNRSVLPLGDLSTPVPPEATNVVAASVGDFASSGSGIVVREDGHLVVWANGTIAITNVPPSLTNAVSVASGSDFGFALTSEGKIVSFGNSARTNVPTTLQDAVALAVTHANFSGTPYALRSDRSVVTWNNSGVISSVSGATNGVALAAGVGHLLMLRSDGTVFTTGGNQYGQGTLPGALSNVVEVAAGDNHSIVRFGNGSPRITVDPYSRPVHGGSNTTLTAFGVGSQPLVYQWQFNGSNITDATNANYVLTNAALGSIGGYRCIVTNALGAVTSAVASVSVIYDPPTFKLLNPPPAFGTNGFSVRIESLSGAGPLVVYASTNLVDWLPILTNPAGSTQFDFLDPDATNQSLRFYKASEQRSFLTRP